MAEAAIRLLGEDSHLAHVRVNGDALLMDMVRGNLYADLPPGLSAALEDDPAAPGSWQDRLADWMRADGGLAAVTQDRAAALDDRVAAPPEFITVYPTAACNLACGYCYNDQGRYGARKGRLMSPETAAKVVEFIRRSAHDSRAATLQVTLLGGEPTLNPVTVDICRALLEMPAQAGTEVMIVMDSNGVGWGDGPLFDVIAARPARVLVEVSIDGAAARHDAQRPTHAGTGSHAEALRTLRRLREAGVAARAVAVAPPPYALTETAEELLSLGLDDFHINIHDAFTYGKGGWREDDFQAWAAAYAGYAAWTVAEKARRPFFSDLDRSAAKLKRLLTTPVSPLGCNAGAKLVGVDTEGALWPCDRFFGEREPKLGHVETGLDPAARADWAETLWSRGRTMLTHPACTRCVARLRCRGGCYAKQQQSTGAIGDIVSQDCRFIRHRMAVDLWYLARAGTPA